MNKQIRLTITVLATVFAGSTLAAVSAEEAKQLGTNLLPWGAEKAGNKEGTIPEYTGERIKVPASYEPKEPGRFPDPWNDKPLFTITAQNMAKYASNLTEGQQALFKKYPDYQMNIYQTRRTVQYPKYVIDNSIKNATACKAVNAELRLEGCYGGVVFPIPKTGNQVVWNHVTKFTAYNHGGKVQGYMVDSTGNRVFTSQQLQTQENPLYDPNRSGPADPSSVYWKIRVDFDGPARKAGEKLLIIDGLDPINPGRRVFQYIPGQRRVKLAPDLAYDTPSPTSGGAATMDEVIVFMGAQDRYDMKLLGKKETFLRYNDYQMADWRTCPVEKYFTKNFPNPDCVRWELHRAWVVEAKLKPGFRHVLPRRVMYFDEDTYGAAAGVAYDASGQVYRVEDAPYFQFYNAEQGNYAGQGIVSDLQTGIYYQTIIGNFPGGGEHFNASKSPDTFYSPESLAGEGIR